MQALRGIDLDVHGGEFVAVMGASGSGKSTCMNLLGCLDVPTGGTYLFRGVDVGALDREQLALLRRHYIGFIFQGFNLLARTSALENVELPLVYKRVPKKERHERARAIATRCCWPPDSSLGRWAARSASPTAARAARARSRRWRPSIPA